MNATSSERTAGLNAFARKNMRLAICLLAVSIFSGCASWTNPVANGIPVRMLRPELLAEPKEDYEFIEWGLLQRTPPEEIVIQPEDVLGIYAVGVLGREDQLPPVQLPDAQGVAPSFGFPIPVSADGTIPLPFIDDPVVAGLTLLEAQKKLVDAYTSESRVLQENQTIILTMIRPRTVRVLVGDVNINKNPTNNSIIYMKFCYIVVHCILCGQMVKICMSPVHYYSYGNQLKSCFDNSGRNALHTY